MLDPAIVDLLKQLVPALTLLAGGAISLITTFINNRHSRNLQRDQWQREDQKALRDTQILDEQKAIEQKQKDRQTIVDIYAKAIGYLSVIANGEGAALHPAIISAMQKVQPYLLQILLTYPDIKNYNYQDATNEINELLEKSERTFEVAKSLRSGILELAKTDSRLKE